MPKLKSYSDEHFVFDANNKKILFANNKDQKNYIKNRVDRILSKEPETINWIKNFPKDSVFFDVGANIGIYTLFALFKGHEVIAIEPEAHNFCLLNRNIMINNFNDKAICYPVALNDKLTISKLNLASFEYGSALHSFEYFL